MRSVYFLIICLFIMPSANAQMGGFNSLSDGQKNVLNRVIQYLGIEDSSNEVKMAIHEHLDFIFNAEQWNGYFNHAGEISSSNYQGELQQGYVTFSFNTNDSGLFFVTFFHKPETAQVFMDSQQIRYGARRAALNLYTERKDDDEFNVLHETDTHALIQEDGLLRYTYFNIDSEHATVVYRNFRVIDI